MMKNNLHTELIERIRRWSNKMWNAGLITNIFWHSPDEISASILSFIDFDELTNQVSSNFLQVGRIFECGHCHPDKYAVVPDFKCECTCHDKEPFKGESWRKGYQAGIAEKKP